MFLGNIDAIKYAVNANLGVSLIPYYAAKFEIENGMLRELKFNSVEIEYPYNLIYIKNKNFSLTLRKFIEVLKTVCSSK